MMGGQLRWLRKQLKLSQTQLAALMCTTSNTIARWERGAVRIPGPAAKLATLILALRSQDAADRERSHHRRRRHDSP